MRRSPTTCVISTIIEARGFQSNLSDRGGGGESNQFRFASVSADQNGRSIALWGLKAIKNVATMR